MKKLFIGFISILTAISFAAETTTVNVPANSYVSNVVPPTSGMITVTGVALNSPGSAANCYLFDTTNAPPTKGYATYTNITSGVITTNVYATNYFGYVQTNTYTTLVYSTNAVVGATNALPATFIMTGVASTVVSTSPGVSYNFHQGLSISNTTANAGSVTITWSR